MKKVLCSLSILMLILFHQSFVQAQTTGSIGGTVVDANGAVLPNASISIRGQSGQLFSATTTNNGTYNVPAVAAGFYTVTVTSPGFKTFVVSNVKVDVGTPSTINAALEIGEVGEIVEVTSGGEVLQTQTATIGTTITGRQITETPIASRDALDLVALLPGTATVGRPRSASINGLPKGAIAITIDGVDVQDNTLRSSDGFFTYVRPRIDAIEEVTVSTASPGSESSGDGAVQIKFATRRGTNDYTGGLFWQHRNTALNSNYWYNNRDNLDRQIIKLNQYGGRLGGPLPFPNFGEGGPMFNSGKDKAFFFVNYEEFRNPNSITRTRTVLTPAAETGNFSYIAGGVTNTVNLLTGIAAPAGQLSTIDPTIAGMLARIRSGFGEGTLQPITNNPNRNFFSFTNTGGDLRKFLALRLDGNITKNHSVEFVWNRQEFVPNADFLNARDPIFPGFPFYGQGGVRKSYTGAVRSNFGSNIVNEARFAYSGGATDFFGTISPADFNFSAGFFLDIGGPGGITSPYNNNFSQVRATPTYDFTDSVTWLKGNHTFTFGGQYKYIKTFQTNVNRIVPTVSFGINALEGTAFSMFDNPSVLVGATAAQRAEARNLYAMLVGRISGLTSAAYLNASGQFEENGPLTQEFGQTTMGLYAQDQWRIRPNFSINFGIRWQPQIAFTIRTANVGKLEHPDQIWGLSGPGNIFRPGTLTGTVPRVVLYGVGEKAHNDDYNNFAPSAGFVWSPGFTGFLQKVFGEGSKSVFRGGYSRAFVREGSALQTTITNNTVGGSFAVNRSAAIGNLVLGTNLRDAGNPNLVTPSFSATPNFPINLTVQNQALVVDPNLRTGHVDSFTFGYQRQLDSNTVVEFRYVGNRGHGVHRLNFINENNTIENGFANEFRLAQANLYANEAAFAAGDINRRLCPAVVVAGNCVNATTGAAVARVATFAYFGTGTGTSALPIMMAYFNTPANYVPNTPVGTAGNQYTATNFGNAALVNLLSRTNPNLGGFIGSASFENDAGRRANAINNGLPINFFRVNPTVPAGAFMLAADARTWYDSAVIEVRRRLSHGLRLQANYVFSKAQSDAFASSGTQQSNYTLRDVGLDLAKNVQVFDLRHNFKADITYDLPFGRGRTFFGDANGFTNVFVGGWSLMPTIRWQSGSPISFGNVQLVGMTKQELQKEIKLRKNPNVVTYLPDDIILNTQRAFDISAISSTGYGTTFGGAPTGRFLAPAGYDNCISRFAGECGFTNLILYGPSFFMFDVAVSKKFIISERKNVEFRATFLDALNRPPFRVGGFGADVVAVGVGGTTFGQLTPGSAYQDLSTTNNPGGRLIDLMLRINF